MRAVFIFFLNLSLIWSTTLKSKEIEGSGIVGQQIMMKKLINNLIFSNSSKSKSARVGFMNSLYPNYDFEMVEEQSLYSNFSFCENEEVGLCLIHQENRVKNKLKVNADGDRLIITLNNESFDFSLQYPNFEDLKNFVFSNLIFHRTSSLSFMISEAHSGIFLGIGLAILVILGVAFVTAISGFLYLFALESENMSRYLGSVYLKEKFGNDFCCQLSNEVEENSYRMKERAEQCVSDLTVASFENRDYKKLNELKTFREMGDTSYAWQEHTDSELFELVRELQTKELEKVGVLAAKSCEAKNVSFYVDVQFDITHRDNRYSNLINVQNDLKCVNQFQKKRAELDKFEENLNLFSSCYRHAQTIHKNGLKDFRERLREQFRSSRATNRVPRGKRFNQVRHLKKKSTEI